MNDFGLLCFSNDSLRRPNVGHEHYVQLAEVKHTLELLIDFGNVLHISKHMAELKQTLHVAKVETRYCHVCTHHFTHYYLVWKNKNTILTVTRVKSLTMIILVAVVVVILSTLLLMVFITILLKCFALLLATTRILTNLNSHHHFVVNEVARWRLQ